MYFMSTVKIRRIDAIKLRIIRVLTSELVIDFVSFVCFALTTIVVVPLSRANFLIVAPRLKSFISMREQCKTVPCIFGYNTICLIIVAKDANRWRWP